MTPPSSRWAWQADTTPRTIVDMIAADLRQRIIDGTLPPGARLGHEHLAAELGVSHIPVREAILALDQEGWVRHESHRGARVVGLTADDVVDDYELRGIVLGLIARRAVEHAGPPTVLLVESLVKAMRAARGFDAFEDANASFLEQVHAIADSPRLNAALLITPPIVPMAPITTPSSMKMRMIAPSDEPRAFKTAISFPFSVTMRSSVQMMQKLATAMRIDKITNDAIFSSRSALKSVLFISIQSRLRSGARGGAASGRSRLIAAAMAPSTAPLKSATFSGSGIRMSNSLILFSRLKNSCATLRSM